MRLIKPSYQIIEPTGYTIDDIYKSIELAGRVSHKSEDRITEDSAKTFVERMMKMKHLSTCEFGTVYLNLPNGLVSQAIYDNLVDKYSENAYSISVPYVEKIGLVSIGRAAITTNYRVLVENNWLDDLKYLCEPTEYHHKRYTVKFILDRAILAEFTRHRKFSFMAESTRYCNYSKGKFNNELTFIIPCWVDDIEEKSYTSFVEYHPTKYDPAKLWFDVCMNSEDTYIDLLDKGWKPEQARNVLPSSLKTELYMCGFAEDWEQFFKLRTASNAHPQARELAIPLHEEFKNKNYVLHNS